MEDNNIVRILNIVPNMRAAGIESFIMNVYRNIDKDKIQFDFLVHNKKREFFDDEIEKMGGKIYRLSLKDDKNILKYIKELNSFFKKHKEYKIIHGHMQSMMPLYLYLAKKNDIPIRIAHSHNGNYEKSLKGFILHLFSRFSKFFSTDNWACSEVAGKYLFGKSKFEVIYNGINCENFLFNNNIRKKKREELEIKPNDFVIGHIGRFEFQKNHEFIIDLFDKLYKKDNNLVLLLIGEGKNERKIRDKVEKLHLTERIKFLGVRKDVNEIYQAMDCFILPSLYEGLPVVGIEAQINSLPCLYSNKITDELKISDRAEFLELNLNVWYNKIMEIRTQNNREMLIVSDKFI